MAQDGEWWVHYTPQGEDPIPSDQPHPALVSKVNLLKEIEGNQPGGGFSINEHFQVIARMNAPSGYKGNAIHVVDIADGTVFAYSTKITFQEGALDPGVTPIVGDTWPGPLCGSSYSFAALNAPKPPSNNVDEIWTEVGGTKLQLSAQVPASSYPPISGALAAFLTALRQRLPGGGRFRVNECGRAFTADNSIFVGVVPLDQWFRPIALTD